MRQIERENRILLNKILAQRPNSGARRTVVTTHERVCIKTNEIITVHVTHLEIVHLRFHD